MSGQRGVAEVMTASEWDVLAINLVSSKVRRLAAGRTLEAAEAAVMMAVARRGVQTEIFAAVPAGSYADGDQWSGVPRQ